jgi:hypothetical protein
MLVAVAVVVVLSREDGRTSVDVRPDWKDRSLPLSRFRRDRPRRRCNNELVSRGNRLRLRLSEHLSHPSAVLILVVALHRSERIAEISLLRTRLGNVSRV